MKKLFVLATVVSIALFSCKSEKDDDPVGGGTKAPETYTQKVIIEYTTCSGCPYCPDGPIYAANLATKYGDDVVYSVAMHNLYQGADAMASDDSKAFSDVWSAGNPTGATNRIGGKCETRSAWAGKTAGLIDADEAKLGVAIDASKSTGTNAFNVNVKVGVGKADLPAGKYYVIGYLVNKEMTGTGSGWDQANGYNGTAGHAQYQKGNPIKNYIHHNVFMKPLGTMNGILMDAANIKAGSLSAYSFDVNLAGLDISKVDVVAFVYFKSVSSPLIENVQRVKLGENKAFD